MFRKKSKGKADENPAAAYLAAKREKAARAELPRLAPFKCNPAVMAVAARGIGGGGGGSVADLVHGLTTFSRPHKADFVCRDRVTGEEAEWQHMNDAQRLRWCLPGDLTVASADKIVAEQGLGGIEDGAERLAAVYAFLERVEREERERAGDEGLPGRIE